MNWAHGYHKELEAKFMHFYENKVPKFGEPVDTELAQYVDGIGNWVRSNDEWGFESERYFGEKGPEIQKTRWVTLLPKERPEITSSPTCQRFSVVVILKIAPLLVVVTLLCKMTFLFLFDSMNPRLGM